VRQQGGGHGSPLPPNQSNRKERRRARPPSLMLWRMERGASSLLATGDRSPRGDSKPLEITRQFGPALHPTRKACRAVGRARLRRERGRLPRARFATKHCPVGKYHLPCFPRRNL